MQQGDSFLSAFWFLNMLLPISRSEDRLVGWFDRSKNEGWSEGNDQHAHFVITGFEISQVAEWP